MEFNVTYYEFSNWSSLIAPKETSVATTLIPSSTEPVRVATVAYEWRYILPPYFIIFLLSVLGNSLVIATLAQNRRMRTVTNVYLLNLAVSDLLLGVFCLPFTLVGQVFRRFMFGSIMCKLIPYLQAVSVSVSVWTLVAISLERYFAICRPLKSRRWQTQGHAYKMIALVWFMSLLLDSPILYASTLLAMRGNAYKCREIWVSLAMERSFNLGIDLALLVVPFSIMSFAYSLIVAKLWRGMRHEIQNHYNYQRQLERSLSCRSNHVLMSGNGAGALEVNGNTDNWLSRAAVVQQSEGAVSLPPDTCICCRQITTEVKPQRHVIRSTHTDKSIEAKRKVIRMLFVIILEFFICWTPLHVINTIYLFYPEKLYNYIGSKGIALLQLIAYCSSCCNPITYCFMNRKFRQAFIGLFRCCRRSDVAGCCSCCDADETDTNGRIKKDASSHDQNDVTLCLARGSHTGRTGDRDGNWRRRNGFPLQSDLASPGGDCCAGPTAL